MSKQHRLLHATTSLASFVLVSCGAAEGIPRDPTDDGAEPAETSTIEVTLPPPQPAAEVSPKEPPPTLAEPAPEPPPPDGDAPIGVESCDAYLSLMERCLSNVGNGSSTDVLVETHRSIRASWRDAAATPEGRAALEAACKAALEALQANPICVPPP